MSATSTISFPFLTGLNSSVGIDVQATPTALLTALALDVELAVEFATKSITAYTYTGGDFNPPAGNTELVLEDSDDFITTSDNTSLVLVPSAYDPFFSGGSAASQTVVSGTGGIFYIANSGTGLFLAAGGDNVVNTSAFLTGDDHTIITGAGDDDFHLLSGNNTVSGGAGSNFYELGAGNNVVTSTGSDFIEALTNASVQSDTISAAGNTNAVTVQGGNNDITFVNGSGASNFQGQTGSDTVNAGVGGGFYQGGTAGNNDLVAGTGQVTLVGGGNGDMLALTKGNATDLVQAGSGNETLLGGQTTGADTFQAGTGNDSISAGSGNDTFLFVNGQAGGSDTISGFGHNPANTIALQGYAPDAVANALASATTSHGSTTFTLSDNTTVTLVGVTHLAASNFS